MKVCLAILVAVVCGLTVSGCGTVGGTLSGAGQDLQRAGEWIKKR